MKKVIFAILFAVLPSVVIADNTIPSDDEEIKRISIFSTTTDWAALTQMPLRQFRGKFSWNNTDVRQGLVLYYLESFPCYGEADSVRVWLGPNKKSEGILRLICVHAPTTISFAWRNATRDADQAPSTGLLTCPVSGKNELNIDISKCTYGPEWREYR